MTYPHMNDDPMDSASNPTPRQRNYYGQLVMHCWYCILAPGQGKVPFDPRQYNIEQRRTAVDITIETLPEMNLNYELSRSVISESTEWTRTIWASLRALGISHIREANGKWAKMQRVPTGQQYQSKRDGSTRDVTTFKFVALYETEEECRAAYEAELNGAGEEDEADPLGSNPAPAQTPPTQDPGAAKERDTALAFLNALAKNAKSVEAFLEVVGKTAFITKHFVVDGPEVQAAKMTIAQAA